MYKEGPTKFTLTPFCQIHSDPVLPYLMFFRSGDGELLIPVRSDADASAVGIQYAVSDILLNRTLSLLGLAIFFSWIGWIFVQCVRQGRYQGGAAHAAILAYVALHARPA